MHATRTPRARTRAYLELELGADAPDEVNVAGGAAGLGHLSRVVLKQHFGQRCSRKGTESGRERTVKLRAKARWQKAGIDHGHSRQQARQNKRIGPAIGVTPTPPEKHMTVS